MSLPVISQAYLFCIACSVCVCAFVMYPQAGLAYSIIGLIRLLYIVVFCLSLRSRYFSCGDRSACSSHPPRCINPSSRNGCYREIFELGGWKFSQWGPGTLPRSSPVAQFWSNGIEQPLTPAQLVRRWVCLNSSCLSWSVGPMTWFGVFKYELHQVAFTGFSQVSMANTWRGFVFLAFGSRVLNVVFLGQ